MEELQTREEASVHTLRAWYHSSTLLLVMGSWLKSRTLFASSLASESFVVKINQHRLYQHGIWEKN